MSVASPGILRQSYIRTSAPCDTVISPSMAPSWLHLPTDRNVWHPVWCCGNGLRPDDHKSEGFCGHMTLQGVPGAPGLPQNSNTRTDEGILSDQSYE